ncbi:MAG: hypothetical protein QOG37_1421 [Mycobacterium sp.]|nr:hypothetical protein [Mycobacterium sp.]
MAKSEPAAFGFGQTPGESEANAVPGRAFGAPGEESRFRCGDLSAFVSDVDSQRARGVADRHCYRTAAMSGAMDATSGYARPLECSLPRRAWSRPRIDREAP